MNEKTLEILEYNKIIELLSAQAGSEMTRKVISELKPFSEQRSIVRGLEETDEAVKLILYKGALPLGNFYDIKDELVLAKKGATLTIKQLLYILYNLKITADVKAFMKGELPHLPILEERIELLEVFENLYRDLDQAIENEDMLSDNASSELKAIRRDIQRQNDAIKNRINQMISCKENEGMLQDSIVTVRDGRYVIPVKQEYRARFPGIIHNRSASGATLFIEPQAIVNMNNELRELEIAQKAEEARILAEFSSRIGESAQALENNLDILLALDFFMAKGKLANLQRSEKPTISENGILHLKSARHPLIECKNAVPIDIVLGGKYNALIVTGPNTGGKTVTLKTAGLLCLMAQSGLHIPAIEGSEIPVFEDVFADIGDEQSIEQSLSTFSSHMKNIVQIVAKATEKSLILLDELGAGTDPTEGAALAIAVLETLKARGSYIMATTHYTELKKYALQTNGVENASMQFDIETLRPTYKMMIGIPGKSNAFEISKKLGLREDIIEHARELLDGGDIAFEEVLSAIENDKKKAEEERDEAIMLNIRIQKQKEELDKRQQKLEREREKIIADAKDEAREMIKEAKELTKKVQSELRDIDKINIISERNKKLETVKRNVKDAAGRYKETIHIEENDAPISLEDIKIGDRVKVLSIGQNGEIIGLPDSKGQVLVQVGIIKMKCEVSGLKLIIDGRKKKKAKPAGKSTYAGLYKSKSSTVSPTINVQGQNLDEALASVSKYIDDALMAHLEEITIIHGRGEGILKKGIADMLKKHPQVANFRKGEYYEGADGVTIVTLK